MRPRLDALLFLACLAAAGCRTDPNIVLLERENRELEDTIYELQACLDEYQQALDTCRKRKPSSDNDLAGAADTTAGSSRPPAQPVGPALTPKRQEPPARTSGPPPAPVSPEDLIPPTIEMPGKPLPEGQLPETFRTPDLPSGLPDAASPSPQPKPERRPTTTTKPGVPGVGVLAKTVRATDRDAVAAIAIRTEWTRGCDLDGRGGDDGVWVFVEPRDAAGNVCAAAGPVSVVVLDPAFSGDAARVARWDFTSDEVARATVDNGIGLEMAWPQGPPSHGNLQLYVRYQTADGRKLEDSCTIQVSVGSQQADNWVPALAPQSAPHTVPGSSPSHRQPSTEPQPLRTTSRATVSPPGQLQSAVEPALNADRPVWSPNRR
ncbi:MAG: hypothetical protein GXY83_44260 [Rhodopirellula sp.]|nr:hypothetical protein [Rhodopirellula sp.]